MTSMRWLRSWALRGSLGLLLGLVTLAPGNVAAKPAAVATARGADRLLHLVQLRLELSADVARAKWNTGRAIDDPVRERELLDRMVAARPPGVPKERVREFFRAQIEASKQVQRELHEQWRAAGQQSFGEGPDLAQLRPELDQVSLDLLRTLEELDECVVCRARDLWGDDWTRAQQTALRPFSR